MGLNTYPSNPFPPSTDRMDADVLEAEVNKLGSDVDQLKSGLTNYENQNNLNLEVPNRKNLCDNDKNGVGYYDQTGTYQDSVHYATSDLIPVEQGKSYVASIFNKTTSERIGALVYSTWDASKNFVAQSTSASITIGSGVSYVRIRNFQDQTSFIDSDNYVYQLEQGSTATAYAPYIPSVESRIEAVESGLTSVSDIIDGTITAETGVTITSYSLKKSYHTVTLQALVNFTPTLDTRTLICVLPAGFRPPARMVFAAENDNNMKFARAEVDTYGALAITPKSSDSSEVATNYFVTVTYIV